MNKFDQHLEGLWANINKARKKGTTSSKWKNDPKYRSKLKKAVKKLEEDGHNDVESVNKQIHDEAKEAPRGRHFKKGSDRTYKNGHASDGNPEGGPRLNSDPTYKNPNESNVQEDGHRDVESVNNQIHTAIKALKTIKDQVNNLSNDADLPTWWTNKVAIAIDKLDGMADYLDATVPERVEIDEKKTKKKKAPRAKVYDPVSGKYYTPRKMPESVDNINEKKADRCKRRADSVYGKKTSAYKSGAIVRCRQGKIWKKK